MRLRFLTALALFVLAASAAVAAEAVVPAADSPATTVELEGQSGVEQTLAADPFFGKSELEAAASKCVLCDDQVGCGVNVGAYYCCMGEVCRCEGSANGKLRCCASAGKPCILRDE